MAKPLASRWSRNLAIIVGIMLPTTLLLYRFIAPVAAGWALTDSYDHTSAEVARAYAVRVLPLLAFYSAAAFACTRLIDSNRKGYWSCPIIFAAVLFALLFQSTGLSGRVPFRQEIELQLPIVVPLVGAAIGCGAAWLLTSRRHEAI